MQPSDATIPSNYSREIARELGLSARQLPTLLLNSGVSLETLMRDDSVLSSEQQIQIVENAVRLAKNPEFGLRLGQRLSPQSHGAMGFMAYSSPDLQTALQGIRTFLPTHLSFAQLEINEAAAWVEITVRFDFPLSEEVHRCLAESLAMMFFAVAEFMIGRRLNEAETRFSHAAPTYKALYTEYLPGEIRFGAPQLMFRLPSAATRIPNASASQKNYRLAMRQCESMLAQMQGPAANYATRVKKWMLSRPAEAWSETEAAAELFMSKRTLARKLDRENSSFRQIREEVLAKQASDYLRDSTLSVESIAGLLHYHDSANFRRAFKRWFGMSPIQFRQQRPKD